MSTLTKVFVVLVTVLSVAAMGLMVSFAANTSNYKQQFDDAAGQLKTAEARARDKQGELDLLKDRLDQTQGDLTATITQLKADNGKLADDLAENALRIQSLQSSLDKTQADGSRLTSLNEQQLIMRKAAEDELSDRRRKMADQSRQLVELADRLAELQSERDAQERIARRFAERNTSLEEEVRDLSKIIESVPPEALVRTHVTTQAVALASPVWLDPSVEGKITRARQVGEDYYVELNVGSNDHVTPGAWFMIHRGQQYLGDLVIETVDVHASAGRMRLGASSGAVKAGDRAFSGNY